MILYIAIREKKNFDVFETQNKYIESAYRSVQIRYYGSL